MTDVSMGIDVGTSHCKVGLFALDGSTRVIATRRTKTFQNAQGNFFYDPAALWADIRSAIHEVTSRQQAVSIASVGVAGMSETGLFVDSVTGEPISECIPWFDTRSVPQEAILRERDNPFERFQKTGLRASFKYGLAKILWLQEHAELNVTRGVWLSVVDYVAFRLTGVMATDYSLAARTFGFRIDQKEWDEPWLAEYNLTRASFPEAMPAGTVIGRTTCAMAQVGLAEGIPVSIGGHDHICAAFGLGAVTEGVVYDSMGTAETLVGSVAEHPLGLQEYESGLAYSCHILPGMYAWIGGLPSSGGAIDWIRSELFDEGVSFEDLEQEARRFTPDPSGILFYPYLVGAGAPMPNPAVRAAFIGLAKAHGRMDMLKAVLEGTAYEMESIRRAAAEVIGDEIQRVLAVGGGTKFRAWLQIKANVSGCDFVISDESEATLMGAARVAALAAGIYQDVTEAVASTGGESLRYHPDFTQHSRYQEIYETMYNPINDVLRQRCTLAVMTER